MDKNQSTILPVGFKGLLPPDAAIYRKMLNNISASFESFGYNLVTPPIIEFEETLYFWAGMIAKENTFRVMDPNSQKMMGVRSDITTQLSRIACTQLKKEPRPLRLSYTGEVFRVSQEMPYGERQLTQAGIELIGDSSNKSDIEVLSICVHTLESLAISNISIDFSIPELVDIIIKEAKIPENQQPQVKQYILKKDVKKIRTLISDSALMDNIMFLLTTPTLSLEQLKDISISKEYTKLITYLESVTAELQQTFPDINITLDPLGTDPTGYHQNIAYSIFSKDIQGEIGRGGRYLITNDKYQEEAVGITLYLNRVFRILPKDLENKKIAVSSDTEWKTKKQLAQDGYQVVSSLCKKETPKELAQKKQCRYIWQNNKVVDNG